MYSTTEAGAANTARIGPMCSPTEAGAASCWRCTTRACTAYTADARETADSGCWSQRTYLSKLPPRQQNQVALVTHGSENEMYDSIAIPRKEISTRYISAFQEVSTHLRKVEQAPRGLTMH